MHALKFPLQSRECLDKDNINLRAVSLELNRFSLSHSQTQAGCGRPGGEMTDLNVRKEASSVLELPQRTDELSEE